MTGKLFEIEHSSALENNMNSLMFKNQRDKGWSELAHNLRTMLV